MGTPEQLQEEADLIEREAEARRRLDDATSAITRKLPQGVAPTPEEFQAEESAQAELDAIKLEIERINNEISAGKR